VINAPGESGMEQQERKRPVPITVIALFQFVRACFIFFIALNAMFLPDAQLVSRTDIKILTYVLSRQNLSSSATAAVFLPMVAAYLSAIGVGLWFMKKWAKNLLMITSGMTVFLWTRRLILDSAIGHVTLNTELQRQTVYIVILVDAFIFSYLAFYPDVADAFRQKE
jgi:hypothetical protein